MCDVYCLYFIFLNFNLLIFKILIKYLISYTYGYGYGYGYDTYVLVNARLPKPSTIIPKTIAKIN